MDIKPIETAYKGYRFRSRLEARWAVFFDALGIPWEYEPEGFQCPSGWYLPDFWLPEQEVFLEIKNSDYNGPENRPDKVITVYDNWIDGHGFLGFHGVKNPKYDERWWELEQERGVRSFIAIIGNPYFGEYYGQSWHGCLAVWMWCHCAYCGRILMGLYGSPMFSCGCGNWYKAINEDNDSAHVAADLAKNYAPIMAAYKTARSHRFGA